MVEVFATNVEDHKEADLLRHDIERMFTNFSVNFDLHDCDRILRIHCSQGSIEPQEVISLLHDRGYHAAVLPDTISHR